LLVGAVPVGVFIHENGLRDGRFACGVEEERLNRTKHWAGFPQMAIEAVLAIGAEASFVARALGATGRRRLGGAW